MNVPRNGTTIPIRTQSPTSQGSSMRRRASLRIHQTLAIQKMATKNASSRNAANANTLSFSLTLWVVARATELAKKIEGARDEDGPLGPCERERAAAGLGRIGNGFDMSEIPFGAGREFPCAERAAVRRLGRDQRVPEHRE